MKIIVNADDFGLTKGITNGIIDAHINGVVDSATIMMNGLHVDHAITLAKHNPSLKIGVHLVLTWGKPLCDDVPSLIDRNGFFKLTKNFDSFPTPNLTEVRREWEAQIEAFKQTGLELHHLDSHHHIHGWECLRQVVIDLAKTHHVPIRYVDSLKNHPDILLTESIWLEFYNEGISLDLFDQIQHHHAKSIEIMTHPGYVDDDLKRVSSYNDKRAEELKILCQLVRPE